MTSVGSISLLDKTRLTKRSLDFSSHCLRGKIEIYLAVFSERHVKAQEIKSDKAAMCGFCKAVSLTLKSPATESDMCETPPVLSRILSLPDYFYKRESTTNLIFMHYVGWQVVLGTL